MEATVHTHQRSWQTLLQKPSQADNFGKCQKDVCLQILYLERLRFTTCDPCSTVCAPDSDIILQSSDAVLFEVHRKNLEVHSEGFAGADAISSSSEKEVVPLSENSAVLELLLQYMYRQPQPDLRNVKFAALAALAEAAEKYQVYSATTVCNIFMRFV